MRTPTVLTPANLATGSPAEVIAHALVEATAAGSSPLEGFLIMLHSASNPVAAHISREQTELHHLQALAGIIRREDASERAALALSLIAGFQVMRQLLQLSPLIAPSASMEHWLSTALGSLLDPGEERSSPRLIAGAAEQI